MKNGIKFNVCGLNFKYFVPFFAVVMLCTYLGVLPTAKVYSNDAGIYVATTFVATVAFLMCIGGLFFWLGNTIPIVNNYLGGACLLPLFGASLMNYLGLIPENLQNGCKVLMKTGKKMQEVKAQIKASGNKAKMIENCGMPDEKIYRSVEEIPDDAGYYSLIIVK